MPYINLIQEQRLLVSGNERKARSFFLLFAGILAASGAAYGFLSMETMFVSRQADGIQQQNKKNEPLVKQIKQNGKDLADLTPRMKTLQDAQTITDRWNHILNHLAVQTPQSAWLTGLRCMAADPTKPIQVNILGIAPAQSPIGEFILRLQNLPDLDNVTLKYTNEKLVASSKAVEFEVDSDMVGTAEQKVKSEGDDKK